MKRFSSGFASMLLCAGRGFKIDFQLYDAEEAVYNDAEATRP